LGDNEWLWGGGGASSNSKQECFVFYLLFCLMWDLESCVHVSAALFAK